MKPAQLAVPAAGLLALAAATWLVLTRPEPPARWLRVEAPARVARGETVTVRIGLTGPGDGLVTVADLHGWTRRKQPLRAISHSGPLRADAGTRTVECRLLVPELPDLATIRVIVFQSPTGGWRDRVRAVTSDAIPVQAEPAPAEPRPLRPLPVHDQVPAPAIARIESRIARLVIAGLWLLVAGGLVRQLQRTEVRPGAPDNSRRRRRFVLVAACVGGAAAEVFRAEQLIGDAARRFVIGRGLYDERLLPQQLTVLFMIVGAAAVAAAVLIRARLRRVVLGLVAYAAIAAVAALSLHQVDAALYFTALGVPLEQLAKLLAVSVSLWGLRSAAMPAS